MLYLLAPHLMRIWGPFRLLTSHLFLIGVGTIAAGLLVFVMLPRLWNRLPRDQGKAFTPNPDASRGKPTGAGLIMVTLTLPVALLVVPFSVQIWAVIGCLYLAMLTGYFDDRSKRPWGGLLKGSLDLVVAILASLALCGGRTMVIWLPVVKHTFEIAPVVYVPCAASLLWITMNATNCSDGVDGLAGSLTSLSLFYLGAFLYVVIGHVEAATYLLVPHNPEGARWAVLIFTVAGGLAGYLWYNAYPSLVLMGDAGSRFLGLLVGVAVLVSGNPFMIFVVAPVVLANGGTGLVKVALLRLMLKMGFDITLPDATQAGAARQRWARSPHIWIVRMLHRVRFPLHDHCRKNLNWSGAQVLLRFLLVQAFLTPFLFALLVKVR